MNVRWLQQAKTDLGSVLDYLLERDSEGRLVPGLAESWRAVDDHTLELKLRHGVTFHNGEPFDAESVQVSAQRMLDPALNSGVRTRFTSIQDVKVVDPFTVQFVLSRPDPSLLDSLSNQMAMLPPRYTRDTGNAGIACALAAGAGFFIHQATGLIFQFGWQWALTAALIGLLGGALGAFYPAIRAANLDPVNALAYE